MQSNIKKYKEISRKNEFSYHKNIDYINSILSIMVEELKLKDPMDK